MKKIVALFAVSTFLLACSSTDKVTEKKETKEIEKTETPKPDRDSRGYYLK